MAETLTVDPTPDVGSVGEVEGVALSADEQDSLALGEQLVDQQEQLLAGKYKDAEALEKAYIELQSKLGKDNETEDNAETEEEEVLPEESEESSEEFSPTAEIVASAAEEFNENGELSAETMEQFASMSSQELVEAYIEVQASLPDDGYDEVADISDAVINQVKNSAGGEQAYQQMVDWASTSISQESIEAFDNIIGSGNVEAINLAVSGLKAQYENANGYEGTMVTGKAPVATNDSFRSQAELVAAMSDRRYDNDPAYRQDVIAKLERSQELQF